MLSVYLETVSFANVTLCATFKHVPSRELTSILVSFSGIPGHGSITSCALHTADCWYQLQECQYDMQRRILLLELPESDLGQGKNG